MSAYEKLIPFEVVTPNKRRYIFLLSACIALVIISCLSYLVSTQIKNNDRIIRIWNITSDDDDLFIDMSRRSKYSTIGYNVTFLADLGHGTIIDEADEAYEAYEAYDAFETSETSKTSETSESIEPISMF